MNPDEAARRLAAASDAIRSGVARLGPTYVVARASRVLDAWAAYVGSTDAGTAGGARLADAAAAGTARVTAELDALFALPVLEQRRTPLEIVRSLGREATAVLRDAGVGPVARDEVVERAVPDDVYDLAPRSLADLGDEELGPMLLVWGTAKAALLHPDPRDPGA